MKKNYTLHFQKSDFVYSFDKDSLLKIRASQQPCLFSEDTLAPAMPYININILIGRNQEMEDFDVSFDDNIAFASVDMAPNSTITPTRHEYSMRSNAHIQFEKAAYPEERIHFTKTQLMDGYKILSFCVSPFTYSVPTRTLSLSDSICIHIKVNESRIGIDDLGTNQGKNMSELVKSIVINPDEMDRLYHFGKQMRTSAQLSTQRSLNDNQSEYVIITDSSLVESFVPLKEWKTIKGVKTIITSIQEIDCAYSSYSSIQSKIKHYLYDMYQQGLRYALLGGNHNLVPSKICYLPHYDTTDDTPVDLYYACFDNNFEWNANGNGIFGEVGDNIDYSPEIMVSRIPVRNPSEVTSYIQRLIKYEKNPDTSLSFNKILMSGNILYNFYDQQGNVYSPEEYSPERYYISDAQIYSEQIYDESISPFWSGIDRFRLYDTYSDHPLGTAYQATSENVLNEISNGYSFVDITTHGWKNCWGHFVLTTTISSDDILTLNNPQNTVFVTIACQANSFDDTDPCLSESFFRNANSGILAYIGSSREGWLPNSVEFSKSFYRKLLTQRNKQIVPALMMAKMEYTSYYASFGAYRKLLYCINSLGDPEFSIYTATPIRLSPTITYDSNCNLSVLTNIDSCKACISCIDGTIYEVYDDINHLTYNQLEKDSYICISKQGYIPCVFRIGQDVYLQNENITDNTSIKCIRLVAGSSVTPTKPAGAVKIQSGHTVVGFHDHAVIQGEFEVCNGAELEISPVNE